MKAGIVPEVARARQSETKGERGVVVDSMELAQHIAERGRRGEAVVVVAARRGARARMEDFILRL